MKQLAAGGGCNAALRLGGGSLSGIGLYKMFVYFGAIVHESTILSFPPAHMHGPPCCNTIA